MLGIVTKFDFLKAFVFTTGQMVPHYDELMKRPVADMMTEPVVHVEPTTPLTRGLELMVSLKAEHARWVFDYDPRTTDDDEAGYRFGGHALAPGEYVSIAGHEGGSHTFKVVSVEPAT
jgi:CBS domain-containing protein